MKGDSILIEAHHRKAAAGVFDYLSEKLQGDSKRRTITIAGESGSGKSETAAALRELLETRGIQTLVLQQDDYFVHAPHSNDAARRRDINWVGPGEVRLELMDEHLGAFREGAETLEKPLVIYEEDRIENEHLDCANARIMIAEGTYTTLLKQVDWRVFIARDWQQTRAHREKRRRDDSELDPFIDQVLSIEHDIISQHRSNADFVIGSDYSVSARQTG